MLWRQSTVTEQQLPSTSNRGYLKQNNVWISKWTELSAVAKCYKEIKKILLLKVKLYEKLQMVSFRYCLNANVKKIGSYMYIF